MVEDRVWVEDRRWRKLTYPKNCRRILGSPRRMCQNEAHYELLRSNGYWAYCEEHMYGQRIRDDIVEMPVHPDSPSAKQGYVD